MSTTDMTDEELSAQATLVGSIMFNALTMVEDAAANLIDMLYGP